MQIENLNDFLSALKRRKKVAFLVLGAFLAITVAITLYLPPVYRSTATILIEQQDIPEDLVRSTITSFADQRIQIISQRVMTRANLVMIIEKYDLYPDERKKDSTEVILQEMREDISRHMISADVIDPRSGRPTLATIAFSLSFDYKEPLIAQKVTNELTTLYLNENLKDRSESVLETSSFLDEEVNKISKQITELEKQLAIFKEENNGRLPEQIEFTLRLLDRTEQQVIELDSQMRILNERKIYLAAELSQISPSSNLYADNGERILSPVDKLKSLETQLISLSAIYSEDHPALKRLNREVKILREDVRSAGYSESALSNTQELDAKLRLLYEKLKQELKKYTANHPNVLRIEDEIEQTKGLLRLDRQRTDSRTVLIAKPDNPAYIQLKAQLDATEIELSELKRKKEQLQDKVTEYELSLTAMPNVERDYKSLTRDYENAWVRYRELKAKQMEAQLAQTMESERKGERFNLIEPPLMPEEPIKPNRLAIFIIGCILSLGFSVGLTLFLEIIDPGLRGVGSVSSIMKVEPLAVIPCIVTASEAKAKKVKSLILSIMLIVLIASATTAVHSFYMPLDVLWYAGLQKIDI